MQFGASLQKYTTLALILASIVPSIFELILCFNPNELINSFKPHVTGLYFV